MSVSKAYNHKSGIYYAYKTSYEWSDEKQKKVAVRKCIGHFDPVTGDVVPNGKRGRKPVYSRKEHSETAPINGSAVVEQAITNNDFEYLAAMFQKISHIYADAATHYNNKARNTAEE